jgi:hypothetical protein
MVVCGVYQRTDHLCDALCASSSGNYLAQTETIGLHHGALALMLGEAKFYPSYRQIRIGSWQTAAPNQTILFLGTQRPEYRQFACTVHTKATSIFPAPLTLP